MFGVEESSQANMWKISVVDDQWIVDNGLKFNSSFTVFCGVLYGMTMVQYLKFLASNGATICGSTGYSYAVFKDKGAAQRICNDLNTRWDWIVENRIEN